MAPLIVLLTVFVLTSLAAALGLRRLDRVTRLRLSGAAMFLLTASAHWGTMRPDLVRMVPDVFPNPELLVTLTGIAELLGAIGLLIPRVAPAAAACLALLLVALFPANVHAALAHLTLDGRPVWGVLPRALLQLLFIAWMVVAIRRRPARGARATGPQGGGAGGPHVLSR